MTAPTPKMRARWKQLGGHVHVHIFGPFDGGCGTLTFREDEWPWFMEQHPEWEFTEVEL